MNHRRGLLAVDSINRAKDPLSARWLLEAGMSATLALAADPAHGLRSAAPDAPS